MTEVQRVALLVALVGVLLLTAGIGTVAGQSSVTEEFNETYGGSNNDTADSVVQTDDGGFAIAGQTESFGSGGSDAWLIKTDPDGNEEFNRTYGGVDNDTANSVVQTDDGGFAIGGDTESFGSGDDDAWLIKTDANGNVEINETFGGSDFDLATSVIETDDEGYALAGSTQSFVPGFSRSAWLIKTDPNGNVETNETLGDTFTAGSILQTDDGGFAIAGQTDGSLDPPPFVGWFAKTDVNGNDEFSETFAFGGPRSGTDSANSIVQTDDGGFVLSGWLNSTSPDPERSAWLVKTNSSGSEQVNETFGGSDDDTAESVVQTDDGGFAIAGKTESFGPSGDMWFIKTDLSGNEELNKTFGGSDIDEAASMTQTSDNDFALAGSTQSFGSGGEDAWLVGVSEGGSSAPANFEVTIDSTNSPVEEGDTLTVTGTITNTGGQQDTQTITATASGLGSITRPVTLNAGESTTETVPIPTSPGDAGTYTATVESENDTATTTVIVEPEGGDDTFTEPLPGFNSPPQNTGALDPTLYEDISGDGDGTDPTQAVNLWTQLVINDQAFDGLTQQQIDALDWNGDGQLTPADAVDLWTQQVLAN